jgi:hypothetical protein
MLESEKGSMKFSRRTEVAPRRKESTRMELERKEPTWLSLKT